MECRTQGHSRPSVGSLASWPAQLALAFVFSFLGAALTPFAWLLDLHPPPEVTFLLSTLFVLTLVTALYAMVIRLRGHRLTMALSQVHDYERQLLMTDKISAVATLAAGAAHDFGNTLMVIAGHAELALEHPELADDVRSDLEQIQIAAQSARTIAAGLLGVVRRPSAGSVPGDLRDAIVKPLAILDREFERRGIRVVTDIAPVLPPVAIDVEALSQVCLNLYLNARDAMLPTAGGTLSVSAAAVQGVVSIAVRDTGTGIPTDFQSRVFAPLQTTKGERGTGLGLSVSRRVVTSAGGGMRFETEEGRGTLFVITLPECTGVNQTVPQAIVA